MNRTELYNLAENWFEQQNWKPSCYTISTVARIIVLLYFENAEVYYNKCINDSDFGIVAMY